MGVQKSHSEWGWLRHTKTADTETETRACSVHTKNKTCTQTETSTHACVSEDAFIFFSRRVRKAHMSPYWTAAGWGRADSQAPCFIRVEINLMSRKRWTVFVHLKTESLTVYDVWPNAESPLVLECLLRLYRPKETFSLTCFHLGLVHKHTATQRGIAQRHHRRFSAHTLHLLKKVHLLSFVPSLKSYIITRDVSWILSNKIKQINYNRATKKWSIQI